MKKIMLIVAAALISWAANAQFYLGGSLALNALSDYTSVSVMPELGYNLSDRMTVGSQFGLVYAHTNSPSSSDLAVAFDPYFRYYFVDLGQVRFFADANVNLLFGKSMTSFLGNEIKVDGFDFGVGVSPGIAIPLASQLAAVAHLGYFGYRYGVFDLSIVNSLDLGIYYCF